MEVHSAAYWVEILRECDVIQPLRHQYHTIFLWNLVWIEITKESAYPCVGYIWIPSCFFASYLTIRQSFSFDLRCEWNALNTRVEAKMKIFGDIFWCSEKENASLPFTCSYRNRWNKQRISKVLFWIFPQGGISLRTVMLICFGAAIFHQPRTVPVT